MTGRKYKNLLFYTVVIGSFLLLMYWIVQEGKPLEAGKVIAPQPDTSHSDFVKNIQDTFSDHISNPLSILLLQIIVILLATRTVGFLFSRIGQPSVIGEVVAGIILGPSVFGMWFPEYTDFLFPDSSLPVLQFFSQVGLILFMFVIGMELHLKELKATARDAVVISHASIIIPYALGMGLSYFLYKEYAPDSINFLSFSLFIGIAMSITAFPVLARILQERGMTQTPVGVIAITCAAVDDITAWCILAVVISIVKAGSTASVLFTIALALGYVLVMLKVVKPLLEKITRRHAGKEKLSLNVVAMMFGVLLISAYTTEVIGIHALFGAFLAGVIMPSSLSFRKIIIEKIEHLSLGLLLPLFFAFSGLRTQIGLLDNSQAWAVCAAIIVVAILGKFGGSMVAARFIGQSWKNSIILGALINTRGLMELVVLNIGYDAGVLTPEIFSMMVLMALVTTFMTGPVLDLMNRFSRNSTQRKSMMENYQIKS